ncbi:MAG: ImpA family type VI secretion system protein [Methylocella sp.]
MPRIDVAALADPLSENDPCGPDLDGLGDEDFLNFVTIAEGLLPSEFFRDGAPFDVSAIDVDGQISRMAPLLGRTRDIRLLSLLARFLVLDRDLARFVGVIEAISRVLEAHWDQVHPSPESDSFSLRAAAIATLDEPTVCIPLQYMPLCEDRRLGIITLRTRMYAIGEAKPREGETAPSLPAILQALRECTADHFNSTRDLIATLAASLKRIHSLFAEHCGFDKAPRLDKISATVAGMTALLDEAVPSEDQKKIAASGGAEQTRVSGSIRNAFGARLALEAVIEYFRRREPSSPVLPLVAQARELQGKTFVEIMQTLLPNQADNAAYSIGDQQVFALPLQRLAAIMPAIDNYAVEERTADTCSEGVAPANGAAPPSSQDASATPVLAESAGEAHSSDDGAEFAPARAAGESVPADENASAAPMAAGAAMPAIESVQFSVATRREAIFLLDEAVRYLRVAEPSSPIPWLIDRAKGLADRDFISVLASVLPDDALRSPGSKR